MSSAGHPPPVVAYPDGRVELLEQARGLPLGTGIRTTYRQETSSSRPGPSSSSTRTGSSSVAADRSTTGCDDSAGRVLDGPKDPDRLLEHILEQVVGTGERGDDIALLAARLLPVAPRPLDLRLAARRRSMDLVRDAMRTWLGGAPLERTDAEDVVLATWEACANAIEHAVDAADESCRSRAALERPRCASWSSDTGRWSPPADARIAGSGSAHGVAHVVGRHRGERDGNDGDAREDARPSPPAAAD